MHNTSTRFGNVSSRAVICDKYIVRDSMGHLIPAGQIIHFGISCDERGDCRVMSPPTNSSDSLIKYLTKNRRTRVTFFVPHGEIKSRESAESINNSRRHKSTINPAIRSTRDVVRIPQRQLHLLCSLSKYFQSSSLLGRKNIDKIERLVSVRLGSLLVYRCKNRTRKE